MKQLSWKSKKIIIALTVIAVVLALIIAIPNIYLTQLGKQTQTGTAAGYEWSAQDSYDAQKTASLDMGDGEYKILVLTDIHRKNYGTFAKELGINYLLDGISEIAIKNLVNKTAPDLILVLGDTVCTARNDIETEKFVDMMDSFEIAWACVFGNHDDEGRADKNRLAEILADSEYGLFEYGPSDLHGAGNYVLSLERKGQTEYALFMMDSGSSLEFDAKTDGKDRVRYVLSSRDSSKACDVFYAIDKKIRLNLPRDIHSYTPSFHIPCECKIAPLKKVQGEGVFGRYCFNEEVCVDFDSGSDISHIRQLLLQAIDSGVNILTLRKV